MRERTGTLSQLLELVWALGEDMSGALARDGLTVSRAHLLWELAARGPVTQRVLADAMNVSARTITGLVDGLAQTGFVTREPHPGDRRATLVTFTAKGSAMAESMVSGHAQLAEFLFAGMPRPVYEAFAAGLDHVMERLAEAGAAGKTEEARSR
ncbi:MarR family winged helix-turn-helix transcriptional regulator [Longispora albida]|uniref:MarR family winged helix-turn-helix transcriptional regulator n=1 Tax=Longispora albida TaxID=203523 RepID=UPI0003793EA3|nr:MarR family transcriptional regulator [Longispora albida]